MSCSMFSNRPFASEAPAEGASFGSGLASRAEIPGACDAISISPARAAPSVPARIVRAFLPALTSAISDRLGNYSLYSFLK